MPLTLEEKHRSHDLALPLAGATVRYGSAPILSAAGRVRVLGPRLAA